MSAPMTDRALNAYLGKTLSQVQDLLISIQDPCTVFAMETVQEGKATKVLCFKTIAQGE